MLASSKTRRQIKLQNILFTVLFSVVIVLLAVVTKTYNYQADWTVSKRNTLSDASKKVLEKIPHNITITAYTSNNEQNPVYLLIKQLVGRYQQHHPDLHLKFIDPHTNPDIIRLKGIKADGELIIEYQGRSENVQNLSEEALTNTLQRLLRSGQRKIVFITGHGERQSHGQANADLSLFTKELANKGIEASDIKFNETLNIPENISVLVIASPLLNYLPGEIELIKNYLAKGGNLLWMHEPNSKAQLKNLAEYLQIKFLPGVIVDADISVLGVKDPRIILGENGTHPINRDFADITIYPQASAIEFDKDNKWNYSTVLRSVARSWSETGKFSDTIRFEQAQDIPGPLVFAIAGQREIVNAEKDTKQQRIVIIGDGDFISNRYLANAANQFIGERIINWLAHDDSFIDIPVNQAPDTELNISQTGLAILGLFFLIVLPVFVLGTGVFIWLRRRKR